MEADALAEKILSDIDAVFLRDENVDEFDILPVPDAQNKSPVVHIGHKMALEAWCVKHLYHYSYGRLFEWKENNKKLDSSTILSWTRAILLLNPDVQTCWNVRKEMILARKLLPRCDLHFSELVLTRKPKSPEVFAHRKWLLSWTKLTDGSLETNAGLLDKELDVCAQAASRYSNNYHAWSHRMWVVRHVNLFKCAWEIYVKELEWTDTWIRNHISDHSGMQYRQFIIDEVIADLGQAETRPDLTIPHAQSLQPSNKCPANRKCFNLPSCIGDKISNAGMPDKIGDTESPYKNLIGNLLSTEFEFITELIKRYPNHESLWYHRRYVLFVLHQYKLMSVDNDDDDGYSACSDCSSASDTMIPPGPSCKKTKLEADLFARKFLWNFDPIFTLEEELIFVENICGEVHGTPSGVFQLAEKHRRWLGLNFNT